MKIYSNYTHKEILSELRRCFPDKDQAINQIEQYIEELEDNQKSLTEELEQKEELVDDLENTILNMDSAINEVQYTMNEIRALVFDKDDSVSYAEIILEIQDLVGGDKL